MHEVGFDGAYYIIVAVEGKREEANNGGPEQPAQCAGCSMPSVFT